MLGRDDEPQHPQSPGHTRDQACGARCHVCADASIRIIQNDSDQASHQLCWWAEALQGSHSEDRTQILIVDIRRAYLNARTNDDVPVYIQFPPEMHMGPDKCGLLRRHMYGTRRAAEGLQDECNGTLFSMGFTQGQASTYVLMRTKRGIAVSVHGDDFAVTRSTRQLDWFEGWMRKHYKLTVGGRLGPGPSDDKEATVLKRVICWTDSSVEY